MRRSRRVLATFLAGGQAILDRGERLIWFFRGGFHGESRELFMWRTGIVNLTMPASLTILRWFVGNAEVRRRQIEVTPKLAPAHLSRQWSQSQLSHKCF